MDEATLRRALAAIADEVDEPQTVPPTVMSRARRRIVRTALAGSLVVVVAAVAAFRGIQILVRGGPQTPTTQVCGRWDVAPAPSVGLHNNFLNDLSGTGSNDIWAAGYALTGAGESFPLVGHWDGRAWAVVQTARVSPFDQISGVAAITPEDAWIVGQSQPNAKTVKTLVEHWNGTEWTVVASPNAGADVSDLFAVDAASSNDLWAVGSYRPTAGPAGNGRPQYEPLVEHWDGSSWSVVESPDLGPDGGWLLGVEAVSMKDVWAVGQTLGRVTRTVAEHWDGVRWRVVPTPNRDRVSLLRSVSAVGPDDVWAVGVWDKELDFHTLVEHWDGRQWAIVPSPDRGAGAELNSVLALGPDNVWAGGLSYVSKTSPDGRSLIEHWDGEHWSIVASPNGSASRTELEAVAVAGPDLWAVGESFNGESSERGRAIAMRFSRAATCRARDRETGT